MKKVSLKKLESIKKDGWDIKKEDRDRIAAQKASINLESAAKSIADSIEKIAQATKTFKPTKDGVTEKALKEQVRLLSKLVENIGSLAKKSDKPPPSPRSLTLDVERNASIEFQDGSQAKGFISRVFVNQSKGTK